MFGKFFYGQCSLAEAFWKFSFLGLVACGFVARLLRILLKQTANYESSYLKLLWNSISLRGGNSATLMWLCFYTAAFLVTVIYSVVCVGGMWNTCKEYEKSKILAFISMILVWGMVYLAIKYSIY